MRRAFTVVLVVAMLLLAGTFTGALIAGALKSKLDELILVEVGRATFHRVVVRASVPKWRELARIHEAINGLPSGLLEAACDFESRPTPINPDRSTAISPKGAVGVCQVMPATAAWLLDLRPDPEILAALRRVLQVDSLNIMFAGQYLGLCQRRWRGQTDRALYCYERGHNTRNPWLTSYVKIIMVIFAENRLRQQREELL